MSVQRVLQTLITSTDTEGDFLTLRSVCHPQGQQRSSRKSVLKEEATMLPGGGSHRMAPVSAWAQMESLVFTFPGRMRGGHLHSASRGLRILRELRGGTKTLGKDALAKYQVSCLLFMMLRFQVLIGFLLFPVGLVLPPAGRYIKWVESDWMSQGPTREGAELSS